MTMMGSSTIIQEKHGLAYQEVLLPPMAPPEWKDREKALETPRASWKDEGQPSCPWICCSAAGYPIWQLIWSTDRKIKKLFQENQKQTSVPKKSEELFDAGVDERDKIRNQVYQKLYATMGHKFNTSLFRDSIQDIDNQLDEDTEIPWPCFSKSITKELGRKKKSVCPPQEKSIQSWTIGNKYTDVLHYKY